MDALMLSRIQFAFTVGYHFIYVPFSLGIVLMVVLAERRYYKTGVLEHRVASNFWIKLFTATFAVGVATGITMEFAFGTNWANYSRFVGNIFGAPLAAEGLFAFFLESTFLGVLLFGRKRVSKRFYYIATWLVLIGAHLSAVWILMANSWQHTPTGYAIEDGRAVLTSFWAAIFNPSFAPRFVHTIAATWIAGFFAVAAISAWYLLKKEHVHFARRWLTTALVAGLVVSAAMPFIGHWGALVVAEKQPVKMAAFEGVYSTEKSADLYLFGWVNQKDQTVTGLEIPGGLSLMLHLDRDATVPGMDTVPPQDRPPVQLTFQSYHIMIGLSFVFILVMLVTLVLHLMKQLESRRWLLWLLVLCVPLPIVAIEMGWMAAEVGRQPWIVQDLLRTTEGVSPTVSASEVATTLGLFALVYAILFVAWVRIVFGIIKKGPQFVAEIVEPASAASATPAPAGK